MKNIKLVGINGIIGSGKDTFAKIANYLIALNKLEDQKTKEAIIKQGYNYDYTLFSNWKIKKFADKLKVIASLLLNIPKENFEDREYKDSILGEEWDNMTVRYFLQKLGSEGIRDNLHKNAWVNALFSEYNSETENWFITDTRFPNEAEKIVSEGGIVIKIFSGKKKDSGALHISEVALNGWPFDYYINNTGSIQDLYSEAEKFLKYYEII